METAFAELPLALFTTLAPIGANAFIVLFIAAFAGKLNEDQLKKLDKFSAVPAVVVLVGFIASIFHMANPAGAIGVLSHIGTSPLSNEICAGIVFVIAMAVYVIMALAGKLGEGARKGLLAAVSVLAIVFTIFCGMAYMMATIISWNTPFTIIQVLGFGLVGGSALGSLTLALAGVLEDALKAARIAVIAVAVIGAVLAACGLIGMIVTVGGMTNGTTTGAALTSGVTMYAACSVICVLASAIVVALQKGTAALPAIATVLAVIGVFVGRLVFYALQMSVGISMM
ncbi:MAG: hypothetical protein E7Z99_06090 [Coriobacteriaceae bacterium]|nr:hypothetical protein [Coriobacteriaceae bacterium]